MCNVAQSLIEEGRKEGLQEGRQEGMQIGRREINCLYSILMMEGAADKMEKALSDDAYLEKLLAEYASQIDERLAKKIVI